MGNGQSSNVSAQDEQEKLASEINVQRRGRGRGRGQPPARGGQPGQRNVVSREGGNAHAGQQPRVLVVGNVGPDFPSSLGRRALLAAAKAAQADCAARVD